MTKLHFLFVAGARAAAGGMLAIGLASCGGGEPAADEAAGVGGEAPTSDVAAGGDAAETESSPANMINAFDFVASGGVALKADIETSELSLTGGCTRGSPMSVGFRQGMPNEDDYFSFSFDSDQPVVAGQTGNVELTNVTWDNGSERPEGVPETSGVRIPTRLEGTGTLAIEGHTGAGMAGNMRAVVSGAVEGPDGDAPIEVRFDINLACAAG